MTPPVQQTSHAPELPEAFSLDFARPFGRNRFKARNFWHSLQFALEGIAFVYSTQRNFRIDVFISLGVLALGAVLQLPPLEWVPLVLVMGLVLFAETINTAVEYTVDLYTQGEFDMRAKVIKDLAAGACLMTAGVAAIVGLLIFGPHLWAIIPF